MKKILFFGIVLLNFISLNCIRSRLNLDLTVLENDDNKQLQKSVDKVKELFDQGVSVKEINKALEQAKQNHQQIKSKVENKVQEVNNDIIQIKQEPENEGKLNKTINQIDDLIQEGSSNLFNKSINQVKEVNDSLKIEKQNKVNDLLNKTSKFLNEILQEVQGNNTKIPIINTNNTNNTNNNTFSKEQTKSQNSLLQKLNKALYEEQYLEEQKQENQNQNNQSLKQENQNQQNQDQEYQNEVQNILNKTSNLKSDTNQKIDQSKEEVINYFQEGRKKAVDIKRVIKDAISQLNNGESLTEELNEIIDKTFNEDIVQGKSKSQIISDIANEAQVNMKSLQEEIKKLKKSNN